MSSLVLQSKILKRKHFVLPLCGVKTSLLDKCKIVLGWTKPVHVLNESHYLLAWVVKL